MVHPSDDDEEAIIILCFTLLIICIVHNYETQRNDSQDASAQLAQAVAVAALRIKRFRDGETDPDAPRQKRRVIKYDHARAASCVELDYWGPAPIFLDRQFERIFRVTRAYADRLLQVAAASDPFFTQVDDALGKPGICPKVKILMGLKCIAYGVSPAAFQDYFQMGETTGRECVKRLAHIVANDPELSAKYRRVMNRTDARKLSQMHEGRHGIAGMIGSLDCMHVGWRLCPTAWQGAYKGAKGKPTIILEALNDYNLWFWHIS